MTRHEKECALAALCLRVELAKKSGNRAELRAMQKWLREVKATICEDEEFPPTQIPI